MAIRHALVGLLPRRWELPLRYWYTKAGSRIDLEAKLLARCIRPGSTAVDIGAHAGLISYLFAQSGAGQIQSVEPLSRWRDVLTAWADSQDKVRVHALACSDQIGEFVLHIPQDADGTLLHSRASIARPPGTHVQEVVRTTTLDILADRESMRDVSVIKIDVEGHEDAVLRGASDLLSRERPALMIEIETRHRSEPPERAFALLRDMRYDGYFIERGARVCRVEEFDAVRHQRQPGAPDYINNFLFLPSGTVFPVLPKLTRGRL